MSGCQDRYPIAFTVRPFSQGLVLKVEPRSLEVREEVLGTAGAGSQVLQARPDVPDPVAALLARRDFFQGAVV